MGVRGKDGKRMEGHEKSKKILKGGEEKIGRKEREKWNRTKSKSERWRENEINK